MNALKEIFISQGNTDEDTLTCDDELNHHGNEATRPLKQHELVLLFYIN